MYKSDIIKIYKGNIISYSIVSIYKLFYILVPQQCFISKGTKAICYYLTLIHIIQIHFEFKKKVIKTAIFPVSYFYF